MIVIGIDQSLAQPGLAAVERAGRTWRVRELASFATEADSDATKSDDDARRIQELTRGVEAFLVKHNARARLVAMEMLSGRARSHRADRTMSLAYGTVVTLCVLHGFMPEFVSALTAKKHVAGSATAEKPVIVTKMAERWGWVPEVASKNNVVRVTAENQAKADALAIASVLVDRVDAMVARGEARVTA